MTTRDVVSTDSYMICHKVIKSCTFLETGTTRSIAEKGRSANVGALENLRESMK